MVAEKGPAAAGLDEVEGESVLLEARGQAVSHVQANAPEPVEVQRRAYNRVCVYKCAEEGGRRGEGRSLALCC